MQLTFALHYYSTERDEEYIGVLKEVLFTNGNEIGVDEVTLYKAVLWSDLCHILSIKAMLQKQKKNTEKHWSYLSNCTFLTMSITHCFI